MPELSIGTCREWKGKINNNGYGVRYVIRKRFSTDLVHRQVMAMVYGDDWIKDYVVMHICDNRLCYRFSHLQLGTLAENNADMRSKNRMYKKIQDSDIKAIRSKRHTHTLQELANEYGVGKTTIRRALRRNV